MRFGSALSVRNIRIFSDAAFYTVSTVGSLGFWLTGPLDLDLICAEPYTYFTIRVKDKDQVDSAKPSFHDLPC